MNSTLVMQQSNTIQKLASENEKTWLTMGKLKYQKLRAKEILYSFCLSFTPT